MSARAALVLVSLSALLLGGAGPALANGRSPLANGILVHPDSPSLWMLRNTFGLGLSDDGGATWRWVCEQSVGYSGTFDPVLSFGPGGAILSSLPDQGLVRSTDGGCRFDAVRSLDDLVVSRLAWPGGKHAIYAAGRPLSGGSPVFSSTDGGATFVPVGNITLSDTALVTGLEVVPGQAGGDDLVVVTTAEFDGSAGQVHVSTDSGAGFTSHAFAGLGGNPSPRVVALADDGATILVVATPRPGANDWVLGKSTTAGASFEPLGSVSGPLFDFVVENGVYLASAGVLRISTDGGQTFAPHDGSPRAYCAGRLGDTVLACGVNVLDGYSLARSDDDGVTFEGVMSYADLGPPRCPEGTPTRDSCGALYANLRTQLDQLEAPPTDGGVPDGGPGPDGGDAALPDAGKDTGPVADGPEPVEDAGPGRDTSLTDQGTDGGGKGGGGGCSVTVSTSDAAPAGQGVSGLALALLLAGLGLRASVRAGRRGRGGRSLP